MRMAGVENVWCCEKGHNVNVEDTDPDQTKDSTEKVKGVFFLLHGDKARLGFMLIKSKEPCIVVETNGQC